MKEISLQEKGEEEGKSEEDLWPPQTGSGGDEGKVTDSSPGDVVSEEGAAHLGSDKDSAAPKPAELIAGDSAHVSERGEQGGA